MRFTVGNKLTAGFLGIALMTALGGVFSISQIQKVNESTTEIAQDWLPASNYTGYMNANVSDYQRLVLRYIIEEDPKYFPEIEGLMRKNRESFNQQLASFEKMLAGRENAAFAETRRVWREYEGSADQILAMLREGKKQEAVAFNVNDTVVKFYKTNEAVNALLSDVLTQGQAAAKRADEVFKTALWVTVGLLALMVLAALVIGMLMARAITGSLRQVAQAADGIAQGDLDQTVEVRTNDELGDMAASFREMVTYLKGMAQVSEALSRGDLSQHVTPKSDRDQLGQAFSRMLLNLREVVGGVRQAAHSVASAAEVTGSAVSETSSAMEEMAASIQQVAGSTHTLAGNVEETSSSIEEMAASIQQVAGNADSLGSAVSQTNASIGQMSVSVEQVAGNVMRANEVALKAAEAARGGSGAVAQTIEGMGHINTVMGELVTVIEGLGKSSAEIGAIVELIDDIAEQTNLLALNAAIEAARAGDHGRGFAVVADEVRKLAERSAKATREIAELIKGIQRETDQAIASTKQGETAINEGAGLAQRAGGALQEIVESVGHVTTLMAQITEATQEQATASAQIAQAAGHMNQLTQKVSGATQEQARSSEQIIQAVDMMNRLTRQVSAATSEQKRSGDQTVEALENINAMSLDLQRQSQQLLDAIAFFKDGGEVRALAVSERAIAARPLVGAGNGKH